MEVPVEVPVLVVDAVGVLVPLSEPLLVGELEGVLEEVEPRLFEPDTVVVGVAEGVVEGVGVPEAAAAAAEGVVEGVGEPEDAGELEGVLEAEEPRLFEPDTVVEGVGVPEAAAAAVEGVVEGVIEPVFEAPAAREFDGVPVPENPEPGVPEGVPVFDMAAPVEKVPVLVIVRACVGVAEGEAPTDMEAVGLALSEGQTPPGHAMQEVAAFPPIFVCEKKGLEK